MTRAAVLVGLVLLAAVPAQARPHKHGHSARFKPLRAHVGATRAKAPTSWSLAPGFTAPAVATPTPIATPAEPTPTPTATPTAAPTVPPVNTKSVSVVSKEYSFTLSQATVDAGDVKVQFDNSRAEDPHQLMLLKGDQLFDVGELPAGEVKRVTLPLTSGSWQLFCPLPEHEDLGMKAKLTVR